MGPVPPASAPRPLSMKAFLLRLGFFSLPLVIYGALVLVADPFEFFGVSRAVPEPVRAHYAGIVDPPLWKMIQYRRHPVPRIVLGDSRAGALRDSLLASATGHAYCNLSYGGGSLREAIATFWFADSLTRLEEVCVGINFSLYNEVFSGDRTQDYRDLRANPLLYFVNPAVLQALGYVLRDRITGRASNPGRPPMTREAFWRHQLDVTARASFQRYRDPSGYRRALSELAAHCRRRGIRLEFVVFPTHADLQRRVRDFGLEREQERFRREIAVLAPTWDYDIPSDLTRDRENFEDPYHCRANVVAFIIRDVWGGGEARYARVSSAPSAGGPGRP